MIDDTLLLSGNDVPFPSAKLNIRQPKIREIALLGEADFFNGCALLNFSKDMLKEEDKKDLVDFDDFDILMSIVNDERSIDQQNRALNVLTLIFPAYEISFNEDCISFEKDGDTTTINKENFSEFKGIIKEIFGLGMLSSSGEKEDEYNPKNDAAAKIAEKLRKGREKAALAKGQKTKKLSVFSRYISILAIGLQLDMNTLFDHTAYQLYDLFKRFQLHSNYDIYLRAKMAGASDLEEVDNWMDEIHST